MLINYFPAVISAGGAFTYNYATELPESGKENELIIIVDETPSEYYLDTNEPESPADNAVWFMIGSVPGLSVDMDAGNNFAFTLQAAKIYDAATGEWVNYAGYLYQNGVWVQFANGLPVKDTLENSSWSDIRTVSDLGMAQEYWALGDTKTITVDSQSYTVRIVGFDHYESDGLTGEKKGIVFEFVEPYDVGVAYDLDGNPEWGSCDLRNELNTSFPNLLPTDLVANVRPVWPAYRNSNGNCGYSECKFFIFSYEEATGRTSDIYSCEASQTERLAYYAAGNPGPWTRLVGEYDMAWTRSWYSGGENYVMLLPQETTNNVAGAYGVVNHAGNYSFPMFVV